MDLEPELKEEYVVSALDKQHRTSVDWLCCGASRADWVWLKTTRLIIRSK